MIPPLSGIYYALALILLTAHPDAELPCWAKDENVIPACQTLALNMELMDKREVTYCFNLQLDVDPDVRLIRRRFRDLHGAPFACDAEQFPSREHCNQVLSLNRQYRAWLEGQQTIHGRHQQYEINPAIAETDELYDVWDTLRDARCDSYYITVRREALKKLKNRLGTEMYYQRMMPPWVPVWRFTPID